MKSSTKFPDEIIAEAEHPATPPKKNKKKGFGRLLRIFGPGVVTGAADDDPSGIATYSQAGAQFGFSIPWTMLFTLPFMTAVQEACMRLGAVKGRGLAAIIREHYSKKILFFVVLLVVTANTFNIGSDIGAMAASAKLLLPDVPFAFFAVAFSFVIILLEVFITYRTYIRILKWLAIALFSYMITAFLVGMPWGEVLRSTFIPTFEWNKQFIFIVVAIFGTTISPYLFFWETSNVVEDEIVTRRLQKNSGTPKISNSYLRKLRVDNALGMFFSNFMAWFIIIVATAVLHQGGVTNINSAADAAKALEPLVNVFPYAGFLAKLIFAIGIIGIGFQAIPVLAGSSAYAISEAANWREGLFRKFKQAREFYFIIIAGTLAGLFFNFIGLNPIKALILTAVFNGIVAVPLIYFIARVSSSNEIMGEYKSGAWSKIGLWATFGIMSIFAILLILSFVI